MSELFLTRAMFWNMFKSLLDAIYLFVFDNLLDKIHRFGTWKCLNCSWLLLCFERCSNLCLRKCTWFVFQIFPWWNVPIRWCYCFLCLGTWTKYNSYVRNTLVLRCWRLKMSELFLTLAMFWNIFKSLLDEIDLYVFDNLLDEIHPYDATNFFSNAHRHTLLTILDIPWS